jgi:hypothetical protein
VYTFSAVSANHTINATFSAINGPPKATTKRPILHGRGSVSMSGTVNPNNLSSTYYFEWGPTAAYGNTTQTLAITSGNLPQSDFNMVSDIPVVADLTGLNPNTIYHYRVVAVNSNGTSFGADQAFKPSVTKADFNNDGGTDILWRNKVSGDVAVWKMNWTAISSGQIIYPGLNLNWEIDGTGDFNNDGGTDILLRNKVSGDVAVWQMNGTTITGGKVIYSGMDLNWEIDGTGDFNSDGNMDILWRHKVSGDVAIWQMNGVNITGGKVICQGVDLNWKIAGTGDFNNDGSADILWRHKVTGDVAVWLMNGTTIASGQIIYQGMDLNWQIMNR